jgi:hypothetical protein
MLTEVTAQEHIFSRSARLDSARGFRAVAMSAG